MSAPLRQVQIPLDHVFAELLAFPLASVAAFEQGIAGLVQFGPTKPTQKLWGRFQAEVFSAWPGISVDELSAMRDRVWFHDHLSPTILLGDYLERHACGLLVANGLQAEPRPICEGATGEKYFPIVGMDEPKQLAARRMWRWVTFALPCDLLLAGLSDEPPHHVNVLSAQVERLLHDHGYGETHLHVGAALAFPDLWISLQATLADPQLKPEVLASPEAPFRDGADFARWLLYAAITRALLASYVAHGQERHATLAAYVTNEVAPRMNEQLLQGEDTFLQLLRELREGHFEKERTVWRDVLAIYANIYRSTASNADTLADLPTVDPVANILRWRRGGATPEALWMRACLNHMKNAPHDHTFAILFWQCVRLRCLFYRYVTQRPLRPGIHWFIRFYGRFGRGSGWFKRNIERLFDATFQLHGAGHGLRSLEIRTSPGDTWRQQEQYISAMARTAARYPGVEFGLVLHFVKQRGDAIVDGQAAPHGVGSHADPKRSRTMKSPNPTGFRYAEYYLQQVQQARAVTDYLQRHPEGIQWLRGVDICSDERGIPNWVFLGPFCAIIRAGQLATRRLLEPLPALRKTIHVGEDFVHPLSGLRSVAETIRHFELAAGDRLGHALALGVDFEEWTKRANRIVQRREERLFDLVWEWDWCSRRRANLPNRLAYLDRELARLSRCIFNEAHPPEQLVTLAEHLHHPDLLASLGFPNPTNRLAEERAIEQHQLLWQYLTNEDVFRRGQETEWIPVVAEGSVLATLQREIRAEVAQRGIIVEMNPSSNLVIGDFGDLRHHPFWRLATPPGGDNDTIPIFVCIGSDDPIVFATDIRREYQLVHDGVLSNGVSAQETMTWLNQIRANGLNGRFTLSN